MADPTPPADNDDGLPAVWAQSLHAALWVWLAGWLPRMAAVLHAQDGGWTLPSADTIVPVFPAWWMAAAAPLVWMVGVVLRPRWTAYDTGGLFTAFIAVAGAAVAGWLVYAGYTSPMTSAPLLVLAAVVLAVAWWGINTIAERRAIAPWVAEAAAPAAVTPDTEVVAMRRMLDRSNNQDVIIVDWKETKGGQSWLLGPRTHDPITREPLDDMPSYDDFTTRLKRLAMHLQTYWRTRDVEFIDNDITPEPGKVDRWWLHINTKHMEEEEVTPAMKPAGRKSWNMPAWLGLFLDGTDILFTLAGVHVKGVGATGGGKSVMANNAIREALTAEDLSMPPGHRDCHVFICATQKLMPIAWPWVRPWFLGHMGHPAVDWIAGEDPERVLDLWESVYRLAVSRNSRLGDDDKHLAAHAFPGLLVVWEEAKHGGYTTNTRLVNGEEWTISRFVAETVAIARSACIAVWALSQDGQVDGIGPFGGDAQRNFTGRYVTVTENHSDGFYNLPKLESMGIDTTKLRHNTIYVQQSIKDDTRALAAKASHIAKTPIIGPLVNAEIAHLVPPMWTREDLAALGASYVRRWNRDRLPAPAAHCTRSNIPWPTCPPLRVPGPGGAVHTVAAGQPAGGGGVAVMAAPVPPSRNDDATETAVHMLAEANGDDGREAVIAYREGRMDAEFVAMAHNLVAELSGRPPAAAGGGPVPPPGGPPAAPVRTGGHHDDQDDDDGEGDGEDDGMYGPDDRAPDGGAIGGETGDPGSVTAPHAFPVNPDEPHPDDPIDAELRAMLEEEATGLAPPPDGAPAVDSGTRFGLPSAGDLARLSDLARRMEEEADAMSREYDEGAAPVATDPGLPPLLSQVQAAVHTLRAGRAGVLPWVATAELAAIVKGADDRETARRLGREISAALPGLTTTAAKTYGPGRAKRGNGYDVADLEARIGEVARR